MEISPYFRFFLIYPFLPLPDGKRQDVIRNPCLEPHQQIPSHKMTGLSVSRL